MAGGNTIAKGSVLISTDADKLHSGLAGAGRDVETWGKNTGKKGGSGLASGLAGGLKGAGPLLIAGAAIVGVSKLADGFSELSEQIDKTSKLAETLDIPTETLGGWQHAADLAGVSNEELSASFLRFRKNTEGDMGKALMSLADEFKNTEDAGARAKLLVDAFGKSGARLAPLFKDGSKGIEEMIADAKALGITFDEATGKQVEAANDAITRTKTAVKGLGQGFLVSLAPMIEMIANFATKFFQKLRPVFAWFGRVWSEVSTVAMIFWDGISEAASEAGRFIQGIFTDAFGWTDSLPTVKEVVVAVFRAVGIAAALTWDTIKSGAAVISIAAGAIVLGFGKVVEVFKEVVQLAENLPEDLRPAGLDKFIKGVAEFEEGVFKQGDKMVAWGENALQNWGKSAEDFNSWLDKALNKAKEMKDTKIEPGGELLKSDALKFTGALLKDSKEAYSLVVKNQFRDLMGDGDTNKNILKEHKKGNKFAKENKDNTKKIADALDDLGEF